MVGQALNSEVKQWRKIYLPCDSAYFQNINPDGADGGEAECSQEERGVEPRGAFQVGSPVGRNQLETINI